ncbi:MAG TPA: glycosyl hydrolase, partial [Gemmatimonadales bacterium]|nr:glycosyl hydrolase [Gemmatimonadales bacterium]
MRTRPTRFAVLLLLLPFLMAQGQGPAQAGAGRPQPLLNQADDPLLRGLQWRVIGPIGQGGRVNDIAVVESDPATFYVGFATAGIWKTSNRGITFQSIFDNYSTHSIGDLAVAPSDPNVLYAGTGEPNNRQSSSFGDGVYKTTDGGKSFTQVGLRETQSIARIVVHPRDPNVVWVAAMGHLFGPNPERGVFKSTDGGRSWTKVLYVDQNTGATDLVVHPTNPEILWAATYQRQRTSWGFASGGSGSGIWKSEDGG